MTPFKITDKIRKENKKFEEEIRNFENSEEYKNIEQDEEYQKYKYMDDEESSSESLNE